MSNDCSPPASGNIFYQDDYGIIYRVTWETTRSGLDVTTIVQDPRVPGSRASSGDASVVGHALFRRGVVTVDRQILVDDDDGYMILSSGGTQEISSFQVSFPCGTGPTDPFCYHLDNQVVDTVDCLVTIGPRWTDPSNPADAEVSWDSVDDLGTAAEASPQPFAWVDVWSDPAELTY